MTKPYTPSRRHGDCPGCPVCAPRFPKFGCLTSCQFADECEPDDIKLMFWEGHARSVLRLIEKGLIVTERGKVAA